jgi:hypothetical protein
MPRKASTPLLPSASRSGGTSKRPYLRDNLTYHVHAREKRIISRFQMPKPPSAETPHEIPDSDENPNERN